MAINTLNEVTVIKNSVNIGSGNTVSGKYSFAQGSDCTASGNNSHAEGKLVIASGDSSHAEGRNTKAKGDYSHAEGEGTTASGGYSHTDGYWTETYNIGEHASGIYNLSTSGTVQTLTAITTSSTATLFSIGRGTSSINKINAFEVKGNGEIYILVNGVTTSLHTLLNKRP